MLKIRIVAVGKIKEKYILDGIEEFKKRLTRFCDFEIVEVADETFTKVDSGTISVIKDREADRIIPKLKGHIIICAINGKKYSSEKLAEKIKNISVLGESEITFVIGGSYGTSDRINSLGEKLSVSDMTFTHAMFRLILTEQIYRAQCINNGVAYHK